MVDSGIILIKYWLEVGQQEQTRRIKSRIDDPRKVWKLSPMDLKSYSRWYDYSRARDEMFAATDTDFAPWHVADANSKKRARLNIISHLLNQCPYDTPKRLPVSSSAREKAPRLSRARPFEPGDPREILISVGHGISAVLTLAVGVAISPVPIIAVTLMLFSRRARVNGLVFLLGRVVALAVVSGVAYVAADQANAATDSTASDTIAWGKIGFGVLFLRLAARNWPNRPKSGPEPEMPKWMAGSMAGNPPRRSDSAFCSPG